MAPQVYVKLRLRWERQLALGARKGLLGSVDFAMKGKGGLQAKVFPALRTRKRTLAGMDQAVMDQVTFLLEASPALHAHIRHFARVRPPMHVERAFRRKSFSTILTRKWSLSSVCPQMRH